MIKIKHISKKNIREFQGKLEEMIKNDKQSQEFWEKLKKEEEKTIKKMKEELRK